MRNLLMSALIGVVCMNASATCWRVTDLRGSSARASSGFTLGHDGFTGQTFEITINNDAGAVKPSNLDCRPATKNSLVCIDSKDDRLTVETWSIDESQRKLVHTKAISGYGSYDGGNLFIGKIIGTCNAG